MKESFFKFSDPYLVSFKYEDNSNFNPEKFDDMKLNFSNEIGRNDENNKASVTVTLEIGDHEKCPFYVKIAMCAIFFWDDTENEKLVTELLENNAVSLLIGYIRPIVASITSSSRFPAYNLPFINLSEN